MEQIKENLSVLCDKIEHLKEKMRQTFHRDKEIALELKNNSCKALEDLQSGKVFEDDMAAENLRDSLEDVLKVLGMAALFILPGGSIGLIAIRKLLQTDLAAKAHVEKLLTLSVEEPPI